MSAEAKRRDQSCAARKKRRTSFHDLQPSLEGDLSLVQRRPIHVLATISSEHHTNGRAAPEVLEPKIYVGHTLSYKTSLKIKLFSLTHGKPREFRGSRRVGHMGVELDVSC